jgi:hypothetical protein
MLFSRYEKEEYLDEIFGRVHIPIGEPTNTEEDSKYELIIENGFYIFLLI